MKKYFSLLAMFAVIFAVSSLFVACGDDDVNDGNVDDGNVEVSVVGVWECANVRWETGRPKILDSDLQVGEKLSIKNDGTYSTTNYIKGKWKRNGNSLNIIQNAANAIAIDYTIESLTSTEMVLYGDMQIGKVRYCFKRVADKDTDLESDVHEKLIDTWGMVSDVMRYTRGQKISRYIDRTEVWVFTDTELTIYDDFDLLNGQTIPYSVSYDSYNVGHIGFDRKTSQYTSNSFYYNVKTLTSSTLVLNSYGNYGEYEEITFNKLKDNPRHTYTMDLTLISKSFTQEFSLNEFIRKEVVNVKNDCNWTWVGWGVYGESDNSIAQPKIKLHVGENTSTSSRTCDITVVARDGNKVIIHITQQGKAETQNP